MEKLDKNRYAQNYIIQLPLAVFFSPIPDFFLVICNIKNTLPYITIFDETELQLYPIYFCVIEHCTIERTSNEIRKK